MQKLKKYSYEGKNETEVLNKALSELNASKEEVYYDINETVSGGLFKSKKYLVTVVLKEDLLEYIALLTVLNMLLHTVALSV